MMNIFLLYNVITTGICTYNFMLFFVFIYPSISQIIKYIKISYWFQISFFNLLRKLPHVDRVNYQVNYYVINICVVYIDVYYVFHTH